MGKTSEELSILSNLFATDNKVVLCKSITGETVLEVVFISRSTKQDFKPLSSFVSLILEQAICGASNSKFSFNGKLKALPELTVLNEVCVPLALVAVVGLSVEIIEVFGSSNAPIIVFIVSIIEFSVAVTELPPSSAVAFPVITGVDESVIV